MIAKKLVLAGIIFAAVALGGTAVVLDQCVPVSQRSPTRGRPRVQAQRTAARRSLPGRMPAAAPELENGSESPSGTDSGGNFVAFRCRELPVPGTPVLPLWKFRCWPVPRTNRSTDAFKTSRPDQGTPLPSRVGPRQGGRWLPGQRGDLPRADGSGVYQRELHGTDALLQITADGVVELSAAQVKGHFEQRLLLPWASSPKPVSVFGGSAVHSPVARD